MPNRDFCMLKDSYLHPAISSYISQGPGRCLLLIYMEEVAYIYRNPQPLEQGCGEEALALIITEANC